MRSDTGDSGAYPRVLFVTPHAFNRISGGGITFSNLFGGWPAERLATAHDDTMLVSDDVCSRYFRLGANEIRKWGGGGAAAAPAESPVLPSPESPSVASKLTRAASRLVFGDGRPQTGQLTAELENWIEDFDPEVLYTILGSNGLMQLVEQICDRFELPLVVHMMDDWPESAFRKGLLGPWQRHRLLDLVSGLMSRASVRMAISDAMRDAYEHRYGAPFMTFQNTVDVGKWSRLAKREPDIGKPARVVYAGSIYTNAQSLSLIECAQAVAALSDAGRSIALDIYSPQSLAAPFRDRLEIHPCIRLHPPLSEDAEFFPTIARADVLLMPVNFDAETVRFIRYSMPTRVPAYLSIGTPILAYGPPQTAQIAYAKHAGWGWVVERQSAELLRDGLCRLLDDMSLRQRLSERAIATASANHDRSTVALRFRQALADAADRA
jgi:glycosyltransferase involved in cell wall biosynthesis